MIRSNPLTHRLPYPVQLRLEIFKVGLLLPALTESFHALGKSSEETTHGFTAFAKAHHE